MQLLAGRSVELAFAIANSAPTIGVKEQILYDGEQTLRASGHNDEEVRRALELVRELLGAAADGAAFEPTVSQLLRSASRESWYDSYSAIDDADDWQHLTLLVGETFEPLSSLSRVECPFLAVYGALDRLLPPWRGAAEAGQALASSVSPDTTIAVFPLGDHRIQHTESGDFVDGYLDLLGDWTLCRVRT